MNPRVYQSGYRVQSLNTSLHGGIKKSETLKTNQTFGSQLQSAIQQTSQSHLKISKHAEQRLKDRNIDINANQWKKIEQKVSQAKSMGVNDSLVLMDNAALIVSAKNNTVITAMDRLEAESQIFTNINGTILLNG